MSDPIRPYEPLTSENAAMGRLSRPPELHRSSRFHAWQGLPSWRHMTLEILSCALGPRTHLERAEWLPGKNLEIREWRSSARAGLSIIPAWNEWRLDHEPPASVR
jgi:hypothetical protein